MESTYLTHYLTPDLDTKKRGGVKHLRKKTNERAQIKITDGVTL